MGNFDCCRYCTDRKAGCHGECEKYLTSKQAYEEKMAPIRKERIFNGIFNSYVADRVRACHTNPTQASRYEGRINRRHKR